MPWRQKETAATSHTPRSWWKGIRARLGGGGVVGSGLLQKQSVTPPTASAAPTKARSGKIGAWLVSRWKKTAPFRANMRWGSLSYIANTWEEEQLAAANDCSAGQDNRAKADSTSCDSSGDAAAVGATDSAATSAAFLRKRAAQGLILGAIVAAAIYVVYSRHRHKPSRPRPRRRPQEDGKGDAAAAAASSVRWWLPGGVYGRWIKRGGEAGGGGEEGGADEDKSPEITRASGGGGGGGIWDGSGGGSSGGSRKEFGGEKAAGGGRVAEVGEGGACPSPPPESVVAPARTSSPSTENDREECDDISVKEDEDGGRSDKSGVVPAMGEGIGGGKRSDDKDKKAAAAGEEGGKQDGNNNPSVGSSGGEGGDGHRDGESAGGTPERTRSDSRGELLAPAPKLSRVPSFWSESSTFSSESGTEELLAEADSLIADSKKASARARRSRGRSGRSLAASASGSRMWSSKNDAASDAARPKNNLLLASSSGNKTSGSSRPSDPRRRKRARVYREVTAEEVDALVSLTHRALQLDPAALSEIAEDASLQKSGEDELSAGELATGDSSETAWDDEGAAAKSPGLANPTTRDDGSSTSSGPDPG